MRFKYCFLLLSFITVIGSTTKNFAQSTPLPANIDTNSVDPERIPSPEKLKLMGVTDENVQKIIDFKNRKLAEKKTKSLEQLVKSDKNPNNTATNASVIEVIDSISKVNNGDIMETIFGHSFFNNNNIKIFDKANAVKAPENYVLGVGDELNIAIWGFSDFNEAFRIDENGAINPKLVGRIYLKGLTFKDAKGLIATKFRSVYDLNNSQIDVSLVYSKVITVNLVGEVNAPGSYTVPATNTAFNVLLTFGGVKTIGSVRNIYIRRGGQTIKTLDVYQYLMNPNSKEDFFLENNDYILVPTSSKLVRVTGQVKRPMSYELTPKENLISLIDYCGGFEAGAYRKRVQIKRFLNNQETIIDVNYDSLLAIGKDFDLLAGDDVLIRKVPVGYSNYVQLEGAVKLPGNYELKSGDKITDIIKRAEGVLYDVFDNRAYVMRLNPDLSKKYIPFDLNLVLKDSNSTANIQLQNLDVIKIFSKSYFKDEFSISVYGAVRSPGSFNYGSGITLKDAIFMAGGLKKEAARNRIEISRTTDLVGNSGNIVPKKVLIKSVQVGDDLKIDKSSENFIIQPYDQIFVRTEPAFELQKNVVILGEVNYPGEYTILNKHEKVSELINRAGGITEFAFPEGATYKRTEFNEGTLFFRLQDVLKDSTSKYNYILKGGDTLRIPKTDQLIQLSGAISYPNIQNLAQISAPFSKNKNAKYYIKNYGLGFNDSAYKAKTYVVEAGGYIHRTSHFLFLKHYPKVPLGAEIVVPVKHKKRKREWKSEPLDWNKAIENFTVKLTGLATLYVLLTKVLN